MGKDSNKKPRSNQQILFLTSEKIQNKHVFKFNFYICDKIHTVPMVEAFKLKINF